MMNFGEVVVQSSLGLCFENVGLCHFMSVRFLVYVSLCIENVG